MFVRDNTNTKNIIFDLLLLFFLNGFILSTELTFTYSKSTIEAIETLEKRVKYVQS